MNGSIAIIAGLDPAIQSRDCFVGITAPGCSILNRLLDRRVKPGDDNQ
jgi:hypothetical protein